MANHKTKTSSEVMNEWSHTSNTVNSLYGMYRIFFTFCIFTYQSERQQVFTSGIKIIFGCVTYINRYFLVVLKYL